MTSKFDPFADAYDGWYDTHKGSAIFQEEIECLRLLFGNVSNPWLEVGVGTGRFAAALNIKQGMDLSLPMAVKALQRGLRVCVGRSEQLPFRSHVFDGVLMVLTLSFLENPEKALQECTRVLRQDGTLVLGIIPADSPWGRAYIRKGTEGHPLYADARFYTVAETVRFTERTGFELRRACSALFWGPDNPSPEYPRIETGIIAETGFVGLLFEARPVGRSMNS